MVYIIKVSYYIEETNSNLNLLKIGYTEDRNWERRKSQYLLHNPRIEVLRLIEGGTELQEHSLHYKFQKYKYQEYENRYDLLRIGTKIN